MIKFLLGESKRLEFSVTHKNGESFVITASTYKIYKDNDEVDSGTTVINEATNGYTLSLVFTPEERGYYTLDISYTIASEIRMARYKIDVD